MAALPDAVIDGTVVDEALDQRHVELPVGLPAAAADAADDYGRQCESRETTASAFIGLGKGGREEARRTPTSMGGVPIARQFWLAGTRPLG